MKKRLLLMTATMGILTAQAADYPYLTFELTDGSKTSVAVTSESLALTFDNSVLTAGDKTFTLTELSKMYFSTTDETTTGISEIDAAGADDTAEYYDLQGRKVSRDQMRRGIYVVKTKTRTFKVNVR